jgi:hypothetical protein
MKHLLRYGCACLCCALGLLTACPKEKPAEAPAAQLPPGVSSESKAPAAGGMTGLPAGVDVAKPEDVQAAGSGAGNSVVGMEVTKAVLDSQGRLGGPYPNSTLAVFSALLYDTAVERLNDVKLLQELLDNGSAVFIPNGSEVDYIYETQHDAGFVAIMYQGKRWYVQSADATLKGK